MGLEETVSQITQACEDMQSAYSDLADAAGPAMEKLNTSIGRLKQWEVTYIFRGGATSVDYRDTKVGFWERAGVALGGTGIIQKEVPHPRAAEARAKVTELFGEVGENDEKFEADTTSIAETPVKVGEMITRWLTIKDGFSKNVSAKIPSSAIYIPTTGGSDGWSGSGANAYSATVGSQDSAAASTTDVIEGLMENCANLLTSMQTSLANFAELTESQDAFYTDRIGAIPTDISFGAIMGIIDEGFQIAADLKRLEVNEAKALSDMLNSSIAALLKISQLDTQITEMAETSAGGWPDPAAISSGPPSGTSPSAADLKFNTQYFKDHQTFWKEVSSNISTQKTASQAVADLPVMFTRLPGFSANQSDAINNLNDRISTDALGKGVKATASVATMLADTAKDYLQKEAENAAQANQIYQEIFD